MLEKDTGRGARGHFGKIPCLLIYDHVGKLVEHSEEDGVVIGVGGIAMALPCVVIHRGLVPGAIGHPCNKSVG